MEQTIDLRGMTWSDPRGYDPVVAAARVFADRHPGLRITWDKRSLQGFESTPVDELAATYDLMIIDHPHVGAVADQGCLLPLDQHLPPETLAALASQTVGKSYGSYDYRGHQWAFPVDAATQVQAIRADLLAAPVTRFEQVVDLASEGRVLWPLRPPHVLMSFFTLCANLGSPCAVVPGPVVARDTGATVLSTMQRLADLVDPICHQMDPIATLDMLSEGTRFVLVPLVYLYAPYARAGYRAHRIGFHDIPALGRSGPLGSALGGTGIAVSARTQHPALCAEFAAWVASAEVQRGLYAEHNGQPGNAIAWADEAVNDAVAGAYMNTRMSHEAAFLRPRHAGYMAFQEAGSHILSEALQGKITPAAALEALDLRFNESFDL